MKTIKKTKLGLQRETLVELDANALAKIAGGFGDKDGLSGRSICPTQCGGPTLTRGTEP
jgi:hypothetical protein